MQSLDLVLSLTLVSLAYHLSTILINTLHSISSEQPRHSGTGGEGYWTGPGPRRDQKGFRGVQGVPGEWPDGDLSNELQVLLLDNFEQEQAHS